ncbi:MAG TPA: MFS transporter [Polyangiaceae bacterium]|nr:MFS transporter [Polyangiaceae bacterium]
MRGSLRVLAHGELRTLLAAALVSNLGTFVQDVGEAWLMVKLGGSPLQIALVSATTWFPAIVLTLPAGVLADQGDRRRVLLLAQGWLAITALALALATALGRVTPFWLLAATTSLGVGQALHGPSWSTYLPDRAPRHELADAVAVQSLTWNLARAVGPALGGLLVSRVGPAVAFLVNGLSFGGVLGVLAAAPPAPAGAPRAPFWPSLRKGLRHTFGTRSLRVVCSTTAAYGFFASPVLALLPAYVDRELGRDGACFGALLGAFGAGALVGALALAKARARLGTARLVPGAIFVSALSTAALGLAPTPAWAAAALAAGGAAWLSALSTQNALLQTHADAALRGRVKSVDNLLFLGLYAAGSTLAGAAANVAGVRAVVLCAAPPLALVAAAAALAGLPSLPPAGARPGA